LSLAHALEWPGKMRLTREQYLAVQPIYYPGFTYAGICEPVAVVALIALLIFTPSGTFWLIAAALAAMLTVNAIYWLLTAPVNKVWMRDQKLSGGAQKFFGSGGTEKSQDWTKLRDRWERSHFYRALAAGTAFLLLSVGLVK
jgi:hypothetical protein